MTGPGSDGGPALKGADIRPADRAGPTLFPASDASHLMTAQTVVDDGGPFFVG
jgi:hypothetical protein